MDLITLLVLVLVFALVVWGGFYICDRSGFPQPVRWIFGAVCLIALIVFLIERIGGGAVLHRTL
jgi:hypothetical protein